MLTNQQSKNFKILLFGAFIILITPHHVEAYIGPGAGFAVVGSFFVMLLALLSAMLALLTWPIRYTFRAIRSRHVFSKSRIKKFVIMGLDGMDYSLTEKLLSECKLPNIAKLRAKGCFKPLETTTPAISPVAWSSFQTGSNPGKHNIFDFLTRDKKNYKPRLSSVDISNKPNKKISFGKFQIPLVKSRFRLHRKAKTFWKILGENGIFSSIIRVPITFPPEKFYGVQLSGMCIPDLRGTQGSFSFYTTQNRNDTEHTGGENYHVIKKGKTIKAHLIGPQNPFRKDNNMLKLSFEVTIKNQTLADITINGTNYILEKGVYTDWIKVSFKAGPGINIHGICKFLLIGTEPEFKLYVTPINIDPEKPVMPISYPAVYSIYLSKRQGSFATLGLAEDSWALNEKIINDDDFIQQCIQTDNERENMFFDAIDKVKRGLCVCVFDGTDRIQHTFWRQHEKKCLSEDGKNQSNQHKVIERLYQRMDTLIGKVLKQSDNEKTIFMIISDHGFNSFNYGIDLNHWLEENGYLKVKEDQRDQKYLAAVDWSQTRAFAIGLAGIFINLKGREAQGIVKPGSEVEQLRDEIAKKLVRLADAVRNQPAIKQVYDSLKIYNGPYKNEAPDLIVGYNIGYRASWETAIGQITDKIFHDNIKAWSGDHCIDPSLVPGVLFCNRPVNTENARLIDIGPTVLDMFGVEVPKHMDGKPLSFAEKEQSK